MKNMSFILTMPQFKDRSKTVTRRTGWKNIKPGDRIMGIEKGMGLEKGEKVVRLGEIEVISVRKEILNQITKEECILEGFPDMEPHDFIMMFMAANHCLDDAEINRIEFRYI